MNHVLWFVYPDTFRALCPSTAAPQDGAAPLNAERRNVYMYETLADYLGVAKIPGGGDKRGAGQVGIVTIRGFPIVGYILCLHRCRRSFR